MTSVPHTQITWMLFLHLKEVLLKILHSVELQHAENATLFESNLSYLRTLADVFNTMPSNKIMFSEVACLLQPILTIPIMTVTAEQTYSSPISNCLHLKSAIFILHDINYNIN